MGSKVNGLAPPDASAALSPSRCEFFAALLSQSGDFPARETSREQALMKVFEKPGFYITDQKTLQFSPSVESAPLLPFSCSQSEPRSRSGAPSGPSPSFYDGYPAEI